MGEIELKEKEQFPYLVEVRKWEPWDAFENLDIATDCVIGLKKTTKCGEDEIRVIDIRTQKVIDL